MQGLEGDDTITNRTWTISSHLSTYAYNDYSFSITVKKAGLISSWLHDQLQPGELGVLCLVVDLRCPRGVPTAKLVVFAVWACMSAQG